MEAKLWAMEIELNIVVIHSVEIANTALNDLFCLDRNRRSIDCFFTIVEALNCVVYLVFFWELTHLRKLLDRAANLRYFQLATQLRFSLKIISASLRKS